MKKRVSPHFRVAIVTPFAARSIAGYICDRQTLDHRVVVPQIVGIESLTNGNSAYDAAILYEPYLDSLPILRLERVAVLPAGPAATADFVFHTSSERRTTIENWSVASAAAKGWDVCAIQDVRDLDGALALDPKSVNRATRRIASVIVYGGVLALLCGIWFLARLQ